VLCSNEIFRAVPGQVPKTKNKEVNNERLELEKAEGLVRSRSDGCQAPTLHNVISGLPACYNSTLIGFRVAELDSPSSVFQVRHLFCVWQQVEHLCT
jgi:hypothetical protein